MSEPKQPTFQDAMTKLIKDFGATYNVDENKKTIKIVKK